MTPKTLIAILDRLRTTYFSINDIQKFYPGSRENLLVMLNRLVKQERMEHLIRGYYALKNAPVDYEELGCRYKKPSYISFEYALNHHGMLNQIPEVVTLATTQKSSFHELPEKGLEYSHLKSSLYFGYDIIKGALMATPEKALLDELYLISLKKRSLSLDDLDVSRINKKRFFQWLKKYPPYTARLARLVVR